MTDLLRHIDRFWNRGIDDRVYGLLRLGFSVVAFLNVLQGWGSSDELLSSAGFTSIASAEESGSWIELNLFAYLRDPFLIKGALVIFAVVHVLLFFGVAARACLILSFYWHFSYQNWSMLGSGGWDAVLGNACFILLLSPLGKSVRPLDWLCDRRAGVKRPTEEVAAGKARLLSPCYGVYLLRVQVFLIYWVAVVTRLPDPYWKNGDFFGYYMLSDFCWFGGPWILEAGWLTKTATWGTQVVELLIPLLLAFRRTWVSGFVLGTLLHLTIAITTPYLVPFSLSMVMIYLAFVRFESGPSPGSPTQGIRNLK
jgi:hypothetical protein